MSLKEILNQPSQFQANVGSTGLDLTAMPIKLQQTITFENADDFNDAVKDPRWITAPLPQLIFQFVPNITPNSKPFSTSAQRFAQTFRLGTAKSISRVGLRLTRVFSDADPSGDIVVEIQSTTGALGLEVPTGIVLGTATPKPANTIVNFFSAPPPPPIIFTAFDFVIPVALSLIHI